MKNNFQAILIAVFLAFFVFAVMIFSGILPIGKSSSNTTVTGTVTVWGTLPSTSLSKAIDDMSTKNSNLAIHYMQKDPATYQQDLIEGFASGTGPDLFFLPDDMILSEQNFIYPVPFTSYPQKTFQDTFIDGASVYLSSDSVLAFPIVVDPLVMYYNKNILSNSGLSQPPKYWDELFGLVPALTVRKPDTTISQSTIALGTFNNITHAKDITALLLLQSGNPIVMRDTISGRMVSTLSDSFNLSPSPAESVLTFISQFSNPSTLAYSWNRGLPESKNAFTGGTLAFYLGHASELFHIESVNPNLSFDVTNVLQTRGTNIVRTSGSMNALAIAKTSKSPTVAISAALLFTDPVITGDIATELALPPARRDLLAVPPTDPYMTVFYKSAITARTWLDPNGATSDSIFSEMIENVVSNKLSLDDAISKAQGELSLSLR